MRIWKIAAIAALGLTSFAADNVAPTKAELEDMYNTAYRDFDAGKFPEALKQLDAIDARQPDLAASKNLRGVILMRQGNYDQAEAALTAAAKIDPKFWNARFNLAEIPFLKKDWPEARKRFEGLLSTGKTDLAKEASQLIQYKILLTYLMEEKSNMVDSILAKLELSPDTPAVDYVKAAVALQQKNQTEANDWISAAQKNYSPQLNKLFVESLYEIGWLEKPTDQKRASLPLMTAAERTEKTKAGARSKFEQSQQAFRQRDFATALKLVDEADKADPNQPATLNLRGEILMQQGQFDGAEAAFKKAAKLDPKLRDAQYNLAQIPFKKKEYAKARDRFDALYKRIPGGDKNQAAELIKFKVFMTYLMEGKESKAHSMMEEFQFTGDTPALYYAQAAWEYKHNNAQKAEDWTNSANKIYSAALNGVFADAFYDVGWLQRPEGTTAPAVAFDSGSTAASPTDGGPAVEPSPIPDKGGALSLGATTNAPDGGIDLASAGAAAAANQTSSTASAPETSSGTEQSVAQSPATGGESTTTAQSAAAQTASGESTTTSQAVAAETANASTVASNENQTEEQKPVAQTSPPQQASVATAPAKASSSTVPDASNRRLWIVGGLLLAAVVLIAVAIVPALRRGYKFSVPGSSRPEPRADTAVFKPRTAPAPATGMQGDGFAGGPRQVSLELKAWNAPVRRSTSPSPKPVGAFNRLKESKPKSSRLPAPIEPQREEPAPADEPFFESVGPVVAAVEPQREKSPPVAEPFFESVGPVVEQASDVVPPAALQETGLDGFEPVSEFAEASTTTPRSVEGDASQISDGAVFAAQPVDEFYQQPTEEPMVAYEQPNEVFSSANEYAWATTEPAAELTEAPVQNDQPHEAIFAEHETFVGQEDFAQPDAFSGYESFTEPEASISEVAAENVSDFQAPPVVPVQPVFPQPTIPANMPETTQTPPAPITKAPSPPVPKPQPQAPAPVAGMQTSVQLTFSFEIAAMQLTPSFKMGVLKVRPISKLVTMRLPSPQRAQSPLNLQVAFEVVKIQPVAGALGTIRVVPSQQQRPAMGGMPSFTVAGLQVVPNSETAPVQLTPSPQGRASVFITVPFQISTLEFSPTLEIGSVTLNSNSKQVVVQLPGAGPGPVEGAPMFEIANLELNEGGEIVTMQLNLLGGPKRA
ncbi:MAG TPA: tetratricopeptide repeat protein [Candidatus Babeliales bacterium]|nr:tetratricopeptide repeat protein [Candidatus Babeliales bacterium]